MSTQNPDPFQGVNTEAADIAVVSEVLAAAAGPASPVELSGEAAALAAFRAARPAPAPADLRRPAMKTNAAKNRLAARLTLKAAVVAFAATSMGGVALAATTGNLPAPLPGGKTADERAVDKADRQAEKDADAAARAVDKAAKDAEKAEDKAAREAAKIAEANGFNGLCNAFLHHSDNGKGKWADSTAFTRLRTTAATATGVTFEELNAVSLTAYCNSLLTPVAPVVPAAQDDAPGKSGQDHGKSNDATHGKSGDKGKSGQDHGKNATAGDQGPNNAHGKATSTAAKAKDNGSDNGSDNGQNDTTNGKAAADHGQGQDAAKGKDALVHPAP